MRMATVSGRAVLILVSCMLATSQGLAEALIYLDDDGPSHYPNIQSAVEASADGDVIVLAPGTYTGQGNWDIDLAGKAITIRSVAPLDPYITAHTIIDCNASEAAPHRAFMLSTGESSKTVIAGVTISRGYADQGGAIYLWHAHPTISRCRFVANYATEGGALYMDWSHPSITDCNFDRNSAEFGGAMFNHYHCSPVVAACTFTENTATYGGAIRTRQRSHVTFEECLFLMNSATQGGAVSAHDSDSLYRACTFTGNSANAGAGYYGDNTGPQFIGCLFTANTAEEVGGALHVYYDAYPQLSYCLFAGNRARSGGSIYLRGETGHPCTLSASNCTFSGNRAERGSAIYNAVGLPTTPSALRNCIVYGNESPALASNVAILGEPGPLAELDAFYCCLEEVPIDVNEARNLVADPQFAAQGSWQPGLTPDVSEEIWVHGDYHLKSQGGRWDPVAQDWMIDDTTSPCIDAGDPLDPVGDEPMPNGDHINVGAYGGTSEASKSP